MHVRSLLSYEQFIAGRDVSNAMKREDGAEGYCIGVVAALRPGDEAIAEQVYASEAAAIAAHNAALPAPPTPSAPAPDEFKIAAYAYLAGAAFVMPLAGYIAPALDALNARNWALARQIIGLAAQGQALTPEQYAHLLDMLEQHGIPEA